MMRIRPLLVGASRPAALLAGWFQICVRAATVVALLATAGGSLNAAESSTYKEYRIKAAFLYNFTKFVDWPADLFPDQTSPIIIGILGRNPFNDELTKVAANRQVNGRSLVIRSVSTAAEARAVHLLFTPSGEEGLFAQFAPALAAAGVLTCGESDRMAALGSIITFVRDGDNVRFAINLEMAERNRLKLNAQLLKLAVTVRR